MTTREDERLGDRLARLREERGLTFDTLGEAAGLSAEMIRQYEQSSALPLRKTAIKIAQALQVSQRTLWGSDWWDGEDLTLRRNALGLSVREFAREVGVSPRSIADWESDMYTPTLPKRMRLRRALERLENPAKIEHGGAQEDEEGRQYPRLVIGRDNAVDSASAPKTGALQFETEEGDPEIAAESRSEGNAPITHHPAAQTDIWSWTQRFRTQESPARKLAAEIVAQVKAAELPGEHSIRITTPVQVGDLVRVRGSNGSLRMMVDEIRIRAPGSELSAGHIIAVASWMAGNEHKRAEFIAANLERVE